MGTSGINKISVKSIGLDAKTLLKAAVEAKPESVMVMRMVGICKEQVKGETNLGVYSKYKGVHRCTNILTGVEYAASSAFFPGSLQIEMDERWDKAVAKAKEAAGDGVTPEIVIEYAYDVSVNHLIDQKGEDAYIYSFENLLEEKDDAIDGLLSKLPPLGDAAPSGGAVKKTTRKKK